jgi:hypothetical protein
MINKILNKFFPKGTSKVTPVPASEVVLETKKMMPSYRESVDCFKPSMLDETVMDLSLSSRTSEADIFKKEIENSNFQQEVSETAYYLWENAGRPDNKDSEFWIEAEKIVTQKHLDARKSSSNSPDLTQSGDGPALIRQSVLFP